jgi:hypothetical protein
MSEGLYQAMEIEKPHRKEVWGGPFRGCGRALQVGLQIGASARLEMYPHCWQGPRPLFLCQKAQPFTETLDLLKSGTSYGRSDQQNLKLHFGQKSTLWVTAQLDE